jgi:hypothetical protein
MGWLDFIFKKHNSSRDNEIKKTHEIICPFCFEKFLPDKVVFRVERLEGDYQLKKDDELDKYREMFGMDGAGDIEPVIEKADSSILNPIIQDGIKVGLYDKNGNKTMRRLCPKCHNDLPVTAGKTASKVISIVGASQVGKSVYIASLIHTLRNSTAGNFNAACIPLTTEISSRFRSFYDEPIFKNGVLLSSTNKVRQEPLIFQFIFEDTSKSPLTLVFFDVAGEPLTNQGFLNTYANHIKNSSGLIFMVDPLQIDMIREKFFFIIGDEAVDMASKFTNPEDVAISLYSDFIAHEHNSHTEIPTAIVITKSDLLHALKDEDGEYIKPNSNIFYNYTHRGYFNLSEFNNIDQEVRKFIQKVDPAFKGTMGKFFKKTGYFAVSALGSNPVDQQLKGVVSPTRVDEPFLWLLHKLGFIEGREA